MAEVEWKPHDGRGDPPLLGDTWVEVRFYDGDVGRGVVHDWDQNWDWNHIEGDLPGGVIVAYRLAPPLTDPLKE